MNLETFCVTISPSKEKVGQYVVIILVAMDRLIFSAWNLDEYLDRQVDKLVHGSTYED